MTEIVEQPRPLTEQDYEIIYAALAHVLDKYNVGILRDLVMQTMGRVEGLRSDRADNAYLETQREAAKKKKKKEEEEAFIRAEEAENDLAYHGLQDAEIYP